MINQPATKMGSQLIINDPKSNFSPPTPPPPTTFSNSSSGPVIMGSSQMLASTNDIHATDGHHYDDQDRIFTSDEFGSQMMYEYIGDGRDNMAFDDDS